MSPGRRAPVSRGRSGDIPPPYTRPRRSRARVRWRLLWAPRGQTNRERKRPSPTRNPLSILRLRSPETRFCMRPVRSLATGRFPDVGIVARSRARDPRAHCVPGGPARSRRTRREVSFREIPAPPRRHRRRDRTPIPPPRSARSRLAPLIFPPELARQGWQHLVRDRRARDRCGRTTGADPDVRFRVPHARHPSTLIASRVSPRVAPRVHRSPPRPISPHSSVAEHQAQHRAP